VSLQSEQVSRGAFFGIRLLHLSQTFALGKLDIYRLQLPRFTDKYLYLYIDIPRERKTRRRKKEEEIRKIRKLI